jgi:hypothetical protein
LRVAAAVRFGVSEAKNIRRMSTSAMSGSRIAPANL